MHYENGVKPRTTALLATIAALVMMMVFALGWTRTARADDKTVATIDNAKFTEMEEPATGGTPSASCKLTVNFSDDYYPNEGEKTRSIEIPNTPLEWHEDGQLMTGGGKFSVDHKYTVSPGILFVYDTTKHTGFADNKAKVLVDNVARGEISLGQSPPGVQQISFPAQWTLREVRYHKNADDATGTMGNQAFYQEDGVTLSANAFKRTDHIFLGWSTTSTGNVEHADKANIKPESSLDLYAKWVADSYTITFKNDDGTELQKGKVAYNTMPQYTGKTPTKKATDKVTYTFKDWTPKIVAATADATYTATYTEVPTPKTATLTFDPAGGTYEGETDKFTITATVGETIKLPAAPTRDGYTFKFWKGSEYDAGEDYEVKGDHTFTAEWDKNDTPVTTFTITFDANGGTGAMDDLVGESGSNVTLTANKFTRSGYTFSGWNTKKDGTGTSYKDKDSIEPAGDLTLYAQWTKNTTGGTTQTPASTSTPASTTTRTPASTTTKTPASTTSSTKTGTTSSTLAKTGDDTTLLIPTAALVLSGGVFALSHRMRRR